jgi:hypothetical protein
MSTSEPASRGNVALPWGWGNILTSLRYGVIGTALWFLLMASVGIASWTKSQGADDALKRDDPAFFTYWASPDSPDKIYPPSPFQREDILRQKRADLL